MAVATGSQIDGARVLTLKAALKLECRGMKRHGRSAYSIIKQEFGFKGNKENVLKQITEWCEINLLGGRKEMSTKKIATSDGVILEVEILDGYRTVDDAMRPIPTRVTAAALAAADTGDIANIMAALTPGGIEAQEKRGQMALVNAEVSRLSKDCNYRTENNGTMGARDVYEAMGIRVIGDSRDEIFLDVQLPEGWELKATDHSMWSKLFDEKGRERGSMFFKAAFYDYNSHFSVTGRFRVAYEPEDGYKSNATYEERKKMPHFGRVYDGETVIHSTEGVYEIDKAWEENDALKKRVCDECSAWLAEQGFPDYKNPFAYWD